MRNLDCGLRHWLAMINVSAAFAACATSAIYNPKNAEVTADAVKCRLVGRPVLGEDAFQQRGFWAVNNYKDLLGIEVGGVRDGVKGLCVDGSATSCDTAWSVKSAKIPLGMTGVRYRLGFLADTTIAISPHRKDGEMWRSAIYWYDKDGKKISRSPVEYTLPKGRRTDVSIYGDIPTNAVALSLQIGFDWPNVGPGNRVVLSELAVEVLSEVPEHAKEAAFESEVRKGGVVSWRADVPAGCEVRFQWRGGANPEQFAGKPFAGPDGTCSTYFTAPFHAAADFIQYRAVLCSSGKATPSLHEVSAAGWTDRDWSVAGDAKGPDVMRLSPSPAADPGTGLRFAVKDLESAVLWNTLKVKVDGVDRTSLISREGSQFSLRAPSGGWAHGIHTAEVCVADFHMNVAKRQKMFYIGEPPATPKVTLRDDGITLVGGKPFFPIGLYAVCKRDFNGKDFDAAFKGLKEGGFNLAHTYGNSYAPDFLAAAAKYDIKLWVAARYPDRRLIDEGRHNPSIIAWYLGDDTSDHILPEVEADYDDAVKAVDPTRITVQADPILSSSGKSRYAEYVTATDGFMPEIYPVRRKEGDPTDKTCVAVTIRDMKQFAEDVRLHGNGKPRTCWAIIQYFQGWESWSHFPSRDQLFAMTFAAVIHGAHGVTWYTYGGFGKNEGVTSSPERWRNICDLATRLSELSPVLVERTPPQPAAPEVLSGPKEDSLGHPSVTCLLKRHEDWTYIFAVNATQEKVAAALPADGAENAEVMYENRTCQTKSGRIIDDFAPMAVHIYRWRNKAH